MLEITFVCPDCRHEWREEWGCACDSECPECGLRDVQPASWSTLEPEGEAGDPLAWRPYENGMVRLGRGNAWRMPAGRYTLHKQRGALNSSWWLLAVGSDRRCAASAIEMAALMAAGELAPISPAELERERHDVALRAVAPLRGARRGAIVARHDASDLALFRAASEPAFI